MIRHNQNHKTLLHLKTWKHTLTRKHLASLILLTIITAGTLTMATNLLFPAANATYVEGAITRDTVWTLVDSPFALSKDVTVYPNATLTIERGVEVRVGGNFSLIINGQLVASGSQDEMIRFTSNKNTPQPGDWNSIQISSSGTSTLAYCSISYAKTGVGILNGIVELTNSKISNNDQDGIFVDNGAVTIMTNEIINNRLGGVSIDGGNTVTVQNNTIKSNGDGILLSGNLSSVSITQNLIASNTQSGIHLNADASTNLIIQNNILSANYKGFYVDGQANTYITNNSVSYNTVGFSYENAPNHVARWNDIYGNTMGMNVLSATTVEATYNYWGDPSGPYHPSLNPAGKGNPVGGDGVDLDFIFFLTAPVGYINQRPVAALLTDKSHVSPGQQVMFFGTTSTDDRQVDQYFYDFGDGQNSGWTTLSVFLHKYSSTGTYNANVKVMDDFGVVSNNVASLVITSQILPPLTVTLTPNNPLVSSGGQVSVTVHVSNATSSIGSASVNLFSIIGGSFSSSSGLTNSTGYFTSTFTAPNVTLIASIRIVASASNAGYVDGSDYDYLLVQPPLMVSIVSSPASVKSGASTHVTVGVTYSGAAVNASMVTLASNSTGTFDQTIGVTGANGTCSFVFTAPQSSTQLQVVINATATKSGFLAGQGQMLLTVTPKVLVVQVMPNYSVIDSEMSSNVTARVSYDDTPVANASVFLSSDAGGSFAPTNVTTDAKGEAEFTFTSPQVITPTNITITATATKLGFAQGSNQTMIAVNLGPLSVSLDANPASVESRGTSQITVHVTYNGQPVAGAIVNVTSGINNAFAIPTGTTDANGDCVFVFAAPEASSDFSLSISAEATKTGYLDGQGQMSVTVTPASSSWLSLPVIIAIVAVAVVVAVVLVLIKLKIIVISQKGE